MEKKKISPSRENRKKEMTKKDQIEQEEEFDFQPKRLRKRYPFHEDISTLSIMDNLSILFYSICVLTQYKKPQGSISSNKKAHFFLLTRYLMRMPLSKPKTNLQG